MKRKVNKEQKEYLNSLSKEDLDNKILEVTLKMNRIEYALISDMLYNRRNIPDALILLEEILRNTSHTEWANFTDNPIEIDKKKIIRQRSFF